MFTTEIFQSSPDEWEKIRRDIISMEQESFGNEGFTDHELDTDFLNKNNIIILLWSTESNEVAGFTYLKPIEDAEPSRANEKGETAYMWDIIIKKEYRGMHLLEVLMGRMEEELKKLGYKYVELDALVKNNFAGNISKVYKERVIKTEPHDSRWGPQVYFRIQL